MLTFKTGVTGDPTILISHDSSMVAIGGPLRAIEVWSVANLQSPIWTSGDNEGNPPFAFSPTGGEFFYGSGSDLIAHDLTVSHVLWTYQNPTSQVIESLAVSADKFFFRVERPRITLDSTKSYLCGSWEGTGWEGDAEPTKIWAFSPVGENYGPRFVCQSIAVCEARDEIAFGETRKDKKAQYSSRVLTRSLKTGRVRQVSDFRTTSPLRRVFYTPDGTRLLAVAGKHLHVWSTTQLQTEPTVVKAPSNRLFTDAAIHTSGRLVAATSNAGTVSVYDTTTWTVAKTFDWKVGKLRCVAFSPDGALAAVGSDTGNVVVWDVDV